MTSNAPYGRGASVGVAAAMLALGLLIGGGVRGTAAQPGPGTSRAPIVGSRVAAFGASFAPIVDKAAPAVVTVRAERRSTGQTGFNHGDLFERFFGGPDGHPSLPPGHPTPHERALGSGVIVDTSGYVLTNNHVVEDADVITVELTDRRQYRAKVIGTDKASDLAVLKVDASSLPTLALGDSDSMRVGDLVLAIGNPLGVGQTVTMGIVSGKGRSTDVGDGSFEDFLQTDAPINQGNSGGALINTRGELIGINSQILSPSGGNIGIGFAIPSRMAGSVMQQLIEHGRVRRGRLGLTAQTIDSDLASGLGLPDVDGALVSGVEDGSPASRAGLKQGDVIRTVNGHHVTDSNALRNEIASIAPGSDATLSVYREGHDVLVKARVGELQPAKPKAVETAEAATQKGEAAGTLGVTLRPLTPELADEAGVDAHEGLLVTEVEAGSRAEDAGLQPGDVIERANGRKTLSVGDLRDALAGQRSKPTVLVVNRKGSSVFVAVPSAA